MSNSYSRYIHTQVNTCFLIASYPYDCNEECFFRNEEENNEHMLFICPPATQVWTSLIHLGLTINSKINTDAFLLTFEQNHKNQLGSEFATAIIAMAWNIWLARNRKIFDDVTTSCLAIKY